MLVWAYSINFSCFDFILGVYWFCYFLLVCHQNTWKNPLVVSFFCKLFEKNLQFFIFLLPCARINGKNIAELHSRRYFGGVTSMLIRTSIYYQACEATCNYLFLCCREYKYLQCDWDQKFLCNFEICCQQLSVLVFRGEVLLLNT